MSYNYQEERPLLFTEDGQRMFIQIRDRAKALLKEAGAFRANESWKGVTGSTWKMMACLDRMVELGELIELTKPETVWAQHRVFIAQEHTA